jgi:hypothetical protein
LCHAIIHCFRAHHCFEICAERCALCSIGLQPFFCHWDKLLGTYLDPEDLKASSKGKKE